LFAKTRNNFFSIAYRIGPGDSVLYKINIFITSVWLYQYGLFGYIQFFKPLISSAKDSPLTSKCLRIDAMILSMEGYFQFLVNDKAKEKKAIKPFKLLHL